MLTLDALKVEQGEFRLFADLSVAMHQLVAIIGPSGGGKSTLLNTIAGFVAPVSGAVSWNDQLLNTMAPGERPISMVFQDHNLFPHLTAFENVAVGLNPSMRLSRLETERVTDALNRVGLSGLEGRKPAALSGGQQSRVALARVLVRDKPLLLLDEPFSALGPALRTEMLDLVSGLAFETGCTTLMVTHDPGDAIRVADSVIFVNEGQVFDPVETAALMANPNADLAAYLGR